MNGSFATYLGNPIEVAWISFLVALAATLVIVAVWQRDALGQFLGSLRSGFPAWYLVGGLVGACLVMTQAASVPLLGVALFGVLIVSGQTFSSLGVDRWGLVPGGRRYLTTPRVVGAALMIVGVVMASAARLAVADIAPVWLILVMVVGALLPFQLAANAQNARVSGSPLVAAMVNFAVGGLALTLLVLVRVFAGYGLSAVPSPIARPDFWSGGLLGVIGIAIAALVVPWLGVLVFGLVSIAGLLVSSLLLDLIGGEIQVTSLLIAGVVVCVMAVVVGSMRGRG